MVCRWLGVWIETGNSDQNRTGAVWTQIEWRVMDPDVCRRPFAKPDGYRYYEYILVYADDAFIVLQAPEEHQKVMQANSNLIFGRQCREGAEAGQSHRTRVLVVLGKNVRKERSQECEILNCRKKDKD